MSSFALFSPRNPTIKPDFRRSSSAAYVPATLASVRVTSRPEIGTVIVAGSLTKQGAVAGTIPGWYPPVVPGMGRRQVPVFSLCANVDTNPSLALHDVEVSGAQAFGVYMDKGGLLEMTTSSASASGTVLDNGVGLLVGGQSGSIAVEHSTLQGNDYSIFNATSTPVRIAMTKLVGPVVGLSPGWACVGAYDQNFSLLNGTCR